MVDYIPSVGYSAKITSSFAKSFKTQIIPLSMCKWMFCIILSTLVLWLTSRF